VTSAREPGWAKDCASDVVHFFPEGVLDAICGVGVRRPDGEAALGYGVTCPKCVEILAAELERSASGPAGGDGE
jgi:hypothetical protein